MMVNLFSIFDPSSFLNLSFNWLSTLIGLIIIPPSFWIMPSQYFLSWLMILETLYKELKSLIKPLNHHGMIILFTSIFSFILFNNFLGLYPYIFTSSSHLSFTLALALPLWMSFMIFGWINNTNHMFLHLVPQGTPPPLIPFMICIETISNIIRPVTLSVRLTANMIAGHLLLTLLSNTGHYMSKMTINMLIMAQILLLMLESAVAIIQSYVFTVLITLYSSETY